MGFVAFGCFNTKGREGHAPIAIGVSARGASEEVLDLTGVAPGAHLLVVESATGRRTMPLVRY